MRHLGRELGNIIMDTLRETLQKIFTKALKCRILATTPPMDIFQRVTLINSTMIPLYNHVIMALPITEEDIDLASPTKKFYLFSGHEQLTLKQFKKYN
jgi:hypothetical protein